jgi:hypothetical protein
LEVLRTSENLLPVQSDVIHVRIIGFIKISETVGVCIAVIGKPNVTKMWTPFLSVFNSNLFAGMLCGFFGVKRKLF